MKSEKALKAMPVTVFLMVIGINFLLLLAPNEFLEQWFFLINEILGNSLTFNVTLLLICIWKNLHCYSYLSVVGLFGMNFINLCFILLPLNEDYIRVSLIGVMIPFTAVVLILMYKKI